MQPLHQLLGLNLATARLNAASSSNTSEVSASAKSSGAEHERCQQKLERSPGTSRWKSVVSTNNKSSPESTTPGPSNERSDATYSSNTLESHVVYKLRSDPWYYTPVSTCSVYQPNNTNTRNDSLSKGQMISYHRVKNIVPASADSSCADMEPKITCGQCHNQMRITWISLMVRCSFCEAIITITRNDSLRNDQRISYQKNMVPATADSSRAEPGNCLEALCGRKKNMTSSNSSPSHMTLPHNKPSSIFLSPGLSPVRMDATSSPNCRPYRALSTLPSIIVRLRPKLRAVLCGVTYSKKRKYKLKGTFSVVKNMKDLLVNRFQFSEEGIRILTEEDKNNAILPTRKNILDSLRWLVQDCQYGDSLVFFFSGHGLRQPDFNEDERYGFDETICPVDFMEQGMILDNDINDIIVKPLTAGVTLHAIVDCCHSGTILDLPLVYDHRGDKWEDNRPLSNAYKGTRGGLAISFSACGDHEMAADTSAFPGKTMNGAMTYIFTKSINENPDITYGQLLNKLHQEITEANEIYCLNSRRLARVFHRKISQEPLLSSSMEFNVNKTKFSFYPRIDVSWS